MLSRTLKPAFAIVMLSSMVFLCKTDKCKAAWQEVYPPRGDEFSVLQKQIRQHKNGGNRELARKVAEQTFNAESLIHDTDRDPVYVILRRTEALVKDLDRMADAPDLSDHQRHLNKFKSENSMFEVNDLASRKKLFAEVTFWLRTSLDGQFHRQGCLSYTHQKRAWFNTSKLHTNGIYIIFGHWDFAGS